jgi:hypothetical protein
LRLWVETATQGLSGAELQPALETVSGHAVRTFQTEEQFFAILVGYPQECVERGMSAAQVAASAAAPLERGASLDTVVETVLASLPPRAHVPMAILHVAGGCQAQLVECDAPPLFLTRRGRLVVLPVVEDVSHGRLVRRCQFSLEDGDYLAMVSEGYIKARGWDRRWGWRDIARAIRRWTDTGCDAEELLGALIRMYYRLAHGEAARSVVVVAMHVRPLRSATVWSGPPTDRSLDQVALDKLMAEPGKRIICGDTTAAVAARLLETELLRETRPEHGWAEVPPMSLLEGVDLVTEGVVTLRRVAELIAAARRPRDLPRSDDGASRLARMLLKADVVHFVVGLALNPPQADGTIPWRKGAIEELVGELEKREKIVSLEYVD